MTHSPVKVVSCGCDPQSPPSQPALQFEPGGVIRFPGKLDGDLLGYYPLGGHGGDDISGNSNHATPAVEATEFTRGILCEPAELLDGRQYFALPFQLPGSVTVSIWHRPSPSRSETTVLSIGRYLRFGLSFLLEPIIAVNRDLPDETNIVGQRLSPDKWHQLVYTFNAAGEARIYVDGLPVSLRKDGVTTTRPFTPEVPNRSAPIISRYEGGSGLIGAAQDVVIRSCVLTAAEIAVEYQSYCNQMLEVAA